VRQRLGVFAVALACVITTPMVLTQARRGATPAAPATKIEPAQVECPSPLGNGLSSKRAYCDVLTAADPAEGIIVTLPPHTGAVTLTFDLHNRHLYSEELVKANRAYRRYTATIGVLSLDNTLISRAIVQNDFRTAQDLVDRIAADTGTGAVKAVAPTGSESIRITIPAGTEKVSILGEKLSVVRPDSAAPETFTAPGRPVAVISNVTVEYRPAPARRAPARRR
jgi:hypothetical protein